MKKTIVFVDDIGRSFGLTECYLCSSFNTVRLGSTDELDDFLAKNDGMIVDLFVVHNNPYPSLRSGNVQPNPLGYAISAIRRFYGSVPIITFEKFPPTTDEVEMSGPDGVRVWNEYLILTALDRKIGQFFKQEEAVLCVAA